MSKSAQSRLDDALTYLRNNISASLADEVKGLVAGRETVVGEELSLGARWDGLTSSANRATNTQQRLALRALLLCQRVYFSDLWPCLLGQVAAPTFYNWLPLGWKDQSCNHWGDRAESEIRDALRMFLSTSDNATHTANAALQWRPCPPGMPPYLTHTRETYDGGKLTDTCYDGVMLWLFKGGLVSLPWLLKSRGANTRDTLERAFGTGTVIWNGPFTAADHLPPVPRGHVVHIFENPNSWRGHWMVSLGNGRAAGVNNNNEEPTVPRDHCTTLTLDKQFLDFDGGTAVVVDPMLIPGRMP